MKRLHLFYFAASAGLLSASIIMTVYFYGSLEQNIPIHFGLSGAADAWAEKTPLTVFLVPLIGLLLFILFLILYKHPQYSSWPTTLILMTVEESKRVKIYEILRSMNATISFIISALMAYLQFAIIAGGNGKTSILNGYVMVGFLFVLLLAIIIINVRMLKTVRKLTAK